MTPRVIGMLLVSALLLAGCGSDATTEAGTASPVLDARRQTPAPISTPMPQSTSYESIVEELTLSTAAYGTAEQALTVGFVRNLNKIISIDYKLQEGEEYAVDISWLSSTASRAVVDSMYGEDRLTKDSPYSADAFLDGFTNNAAGVYNQYVSRTDGLYEGEFRLVEMHSFINIGTAEHEGMQELTATLQYTDNYEDFAGLLPEGRGLYHGDTTFKVRVALFPDEETGTWRIAEYRAEE